MFDKPISEANFLLDVTNLKRSIFNQEVSLCNYRGEDIEWKIAVEGSNFRPISASQLKSAFLRLMKVKAKGKCWIYKVTQPHSFLAVNLVQEFRMLEVYVVRMKHSNYVIVKTDTTNADAARFQLVYHDSDNLPTGKDGD